MSWFRRPRVEEEAAPPPNDGLYAVIEGNLVDGYKITVFDEGVELHNELFRQWFDDAYPEHVFEKMGRRRASALLARERQRRTTHVEDVITF